MGGIVAIFALLVTVLVGWNIYSVIDFKEKIHEAKMDYNEIKKKIKSVDQSACDANISTNYSLYLFYKDGNKPAGAITSLIIALSYMVEIDLAENIKSRNINRFSDYLSDILDGEGKFEFGKNNIDIIKKHLGKIRAHKDYHYIKDLFENSFEKIEKLISEETNSHRT